MQFKSGMLGVCIVVLSLLGTVLSGFLLGVEPDTRQVTTYDYVTDVTGLFDITDTPEYVDYSPSTNYVGYTPALAVDYTPSSTVNAYRYVVADGANSTSTQTVTYNSSFASDTGRFSPAQAGSHAYINWTGSINFGTTTTFQGITYNAGTAGVSVTVDGVVGSMPMITSLARVIDSWNLGTYNTLSIDLTYGTMPIMFYYGNWTFTNVERGDNLTQYIYSVELNESNSMPTHMDVDLATMAVKAYRNDTELWNVNASQVDVIYRYSDRSSGSFAGAENASVTMAVTAQSYPTYGYMDPTKGVSLDLFGPSTEYSVTSSDSYTAMSGIFSPPTIAYPDSVDTLSFDFSYTSDANYYGLVDTSLLVETFTKNVSLSLKNVDGVSPLFNVDGVSIPNVNNVSRSFPNITSLGAWMVHWGYDITDYSVVDIDISAYSGGLTIDNPVAFFPKSAVSVELNASSTLMLKVTYGSTHEPDNLSINGATGLVTATLNDSVLWTANINDVVVVNKSSDDDLGSHLAFTFYGVPGANTGPSYAILYIDNTGDYAGTWNDSLTIAGTPVNTAVYMDTVNKELALASLDDVMAGWGMVSGQYVINLDHGTYPLYMFPTTSVPWSYLTVGDYTQPWACYAYSAGSGAPYTVIDRLVYDVDNDSVTAYSGGLYRWTADPSDVWVANKYVLLDGSSNIPDVYQAGGLASVNTTVTVRAVISNTATWTNGYQNDEINLTIQRYDLNGNDVTIRAGTSRISVSIDGTGAISATDGYGVYSIGKWKAIGIKISATDGTLSITPTNSLSFTTPIDTNNTTVTISNWYSGNAITQLTFGTTGQSPYWQITKTSVFLDTYESVMFNPSIDINDYFPDMGNWRLNFYSFATYGDSFTINNVLFTVDRTRGTCTWSLPMGDEVQQYTKALNNMYVTKEVIDDNEHTVLTFANDKASYDLGLSVSDTISFTGLWYFTTGLYSVQQATEEYYNWALDSAFHIDGDQAVLIFMGLLVLGALLCKGLFRQKFKTLDMVVIVGAGIVLMLLIGGL